MFIFFLIWLYYSKFPHPMVRETCLLRHWVRLRKRSHIEVHHRSNNYIATTFVLSFPFYILKVSNAAVAFPLSNVNKM